MSILAPTKYSLLRSIVSLDNRGSIIVVQTIINSCARHSCMHDKNKYLILKSQTAIAFAGSDTER